MSAPGSSSDPARLRFRRNQNHNKNFQKKYTFDNLKRFQSVYTPLIVYVTRIFKGDLLRGMSNGIQFHY